MSPTSYAAAVTAQPTLANASPRSTETAWSLTPNTTVTRAASPMETGDDNDDCESYTAVKLQRTLTACPVGSLEYPPSLSSSPSTNDSDVTPPVTPSSPNGEEDRALVRAPPSDTSPGVLQQFLWSIAQAREANATGKHAYSSPRDAGLTGYAAAPPNTPASTAVNDPRPRPQRIPLFPPGWPSTFTPWTPPTAPAVHPSRVGAAGPHNHLIYTPNEPRPPMLIPRVQPFNATGPANGQNIDAMVRVLSLNPTVSAQEWPRLSTAEQAAFRVGVAGLANRVIGRGGYDWFELPDMPVILNHLVTHDGLDYWVSTGRWVRDTCVAAYRGGHTAVRSYWDGVSRGTPPKMTPEDARKLRRTPQYRGQYGLWLNRYARRALEGPNPRSQRRVLADLNERRK